MSAHVTIIVVVLPLVAAIICIISQRAMFAWIISVAAQSGVLATTLYIAHVVWHEQEIRYALGGWPPPWGIAQQVDGLSSIILVLFSVISLLLLIAARRGLPLDLPETKIAPAYACLLLNLAALNGIAVTGDAFNLYVFVEIASLSSYALLAMGREPMALIAAFRYLILGTIGASFILIGVGLLYAVTGSLNLEDIAARLANHEHSRTAVSAFIFLITGFCLKFALFPLHHWLPMAYRYAPSMIAAIFSSIGSKVYLYAIMRCFAVFGSANLLYLYVQPVLFCVSIGAIFYGGIYALKQTSLPQLFAYSSVSQIGYIVLAISFATPVAITAAIIHIVAHAVAMASVFLALILIKHDGISFSTTDLHGLVQRAPWASAVIAIASLSLVGIPGTLGFISKWHLVLAALNSTHAILAVASIVLGSLLALAYSFKIAEIIFLGELPTVVKKAHGIPWSMKIPACFLIGITLYYGMQSHTIVVLAKRAAAIVVS